MTYNARRQLLDICPMSVKNKEFDCYLPKTIRPDFPPVFSNL